MGLGAKRYSDAAVTLFVHEEWLKTAIVTL
jgi:hypothetical protein